ncbi:nudix/MutT family protein [Metarhizium acridum CQMa 102]|uniref:Nudix/MutT family protein n=1 Tax=Metarhizium acridum (strain CQMa 102) TaxID=655827 RepID=E9E0Z1_METAQ|nr:nudix/MutT family protein [Metarhizium acridum CQMa 102]EFY90293.1 nudix/MutT family protein [Metarhizium acridum CQMa 102]
MSGPGSETSDGRSMQSRTGRNKQRQLANAFSTRNLGYNSKGERLVAGVVPLSPDLNFVLLVQSTRRKGWVLPKGGWETDESCQEAATREAWEEAGITIQIDYDLGTIDEKRPPKSSKDRSRYSFFQATVLSEVEDWPERHKRERQWFTYTQALDALATRPELQEALQRSTINQL